MTWDYDDIITLPRPRSTRRKPMELSGRAAQFAPFAALTGYEDCIAEKSRLTEPQRLLDEYQHDILDRTIRYLADFQDTHPYITIHYFIPDPLKAGGYHSQISGRLKQIDLAQQCLILEDSTTMPLDQILDIPVIRSHIGHNST